MLHHVEDSTVQTLTREMDDYLQTTLARLKLEWTGLVKTAHRAISTSMRTVKEIPVYTNKLFVFWKAFLRVWKHFRWEEVEIAAKVGRKAPLPAS